MKSIKSYLGVVVISGCVMISCKKDNLPRTSGSAFTIVNAVVGSSFLFTDFNGTGNSKTTDTLKWFLAHVTSAKYVPEGSFVEISSYTGLTHLALFNFPDTLHSIFNGSFDLSLNSIHTLFMSGTIAQPDSLFTTDIPPYHPATDSSIGIRFVNLSTGSTPVSVDRQGQPNGSEVTSLPYKSITDFKNYSAKASVDSYSFEFRDAASGTLLTTYTMRGVNDGLINTRTNQLRFRNFTLVLQGTPSSPNAFIVSNSF